VSQFTNWLDSRSFPPTRYLQGLTKGIDISQGETLVWDYLNGKIKTYEVFKEKFDEFYKDKSKLALDTLIEVYEEGNWLNKEQRKKLRLPEEKYGRINTKAARAMAEYKMRWM
jgi:hypothetical protein